MHFYKTTVLAIIFLKEELHKLFNNTNVTPFKNIDDPVEWQRKQRDEW